MSFPLRRVAFGVILAAAGLASCATSGVARWDAETVTVERAVCFLHPVGSSAVEGVVEFAQVGDGVRVSGRISGLTPGKHGFHVHEFGDLRDRERGESAGDHFSPDGHPHGAREAPRRHVGDLGNVTAGADGVATVDFVDPRISLGGMRSIIGRSLVVHANEDTYVQPAGGAGPRVAVGVIGIAKRDGAAPPRAHGR